ncbi:MAG: hypothetical protein IKR19_08170 [Acholeplasmatales bacterium]|nr:hypothetical protein [Acholeplasmatales bacterium]
MVFSVDTILDSNNKTPSIMMDEVVKEEKSTFDMAIDIIAYENTLFNDTLDRYLNEGMMDRIAQFDFSTILAKIFDLFVSALGKLANSFAAFLLGFINKDAELAAFKGKLANYRGNIRYTKPYYTYTNISANTMPAMEYKNQIDLVYYNFTGDFSSQMSQIKDSNELVMAMENRLGEGLGNINSPLLLKIRSELTDNKSDVYFDMYHDQLFRYFRNGEINKTTDKVRMFEKNIDGERIAIAYKDYYAAKQQIAIINRESFKYRAEAMSAKAKIRTFNPLSYINKSLITPEVLTTYNRLVSANCKEIRNICDMYLLYFAAKIDAIKEYNYTNKEILLLACKQMVRDSGNND